MMDPALFLAFVAATVVLALFPGPNMALIVGNSVAYGTRWGLLTLCGTSAALAIQLAVVALGMGALLGAFGTWFAVLRWVGAAYLLVLGIRTWMAPPAALAPARLGPRGVRATVLRGLLVSLTNPKVLLFFGAFFPQFVSPHHALAPQLLLMSLTFLLTVSLLDALWATLAGRARGWIARRGRLLNRISGGMLAGAGVGLALVRVK
jgi:threonine/homoserine/homoserine lactone efflux protein